MNVTINGHAQIFEAGSCPTINIDLSGSPAPQQVQLPQENETPHPDLCTYIIQNDIKPMEEIEKEMAAAARKSAPALVNYIKQALRLGYIDLRGDNSKTVYETLRDHFGLTYTYSNWMLYFS